MIDNVLKPSMLGYTSKDLDRICVYAHYINGNIFYVGEGKVSRAFVINNNVRNKLWYKVYNSNPETFNIKILYIDITKEESVRLESELIAKYGRLDNNTGCLTNGNNGGCCIDADYENNWGYNKRFFGKDNPNYGNKYNLNSNSKPIVQVDIFGDVVRTWSSATEAEETIKEFNSGCIGYCCKGIRHIHAGYQWFYLEAFDPKKALYKPGDTNSRIILKIDNSTKQFIKLYHNNKELKVDGFDPKGVNKVTSGYRKTYLGYKFVDFYRLCKTDRLKYKHLIDVTKI